MPTLHYHHTANKYLAWLAERMRYRARCCPSSTINQWRIAYLAPRTDYVRHLRSKLAGMLRRKRAKRKGKATCVCWAPLSTLQLPP